MTRQWQSVSQFGSNTRGATHCGKGGTAFRRASATRFRSSSPDHLLRKAPFWPLKQAVLRFLRGMMQRQRPEVDRRLRTTTLGKFWAGITTRPRRTVPAISEKQTSGRWLCLRRRPTQSMLGLRSGLAAGFALGGFRASSLAVRSSLGLLLMSLPPTAAALAVPTQYSTALWSLISARVQNVCSHHSLC